MGEYTLFWMGKMVAESILVVVVLLVFFFMAIVPPILKKRRCSHIEYREDSSCNAICTKCDKNLGFIGFIRDKA